MSVILEEVPLDQAEIKTFTLFRGDSSLPMGIAPYSPKMRRVIRGGMSFREAFDSVYNELFYDWWDLAYESSSVWFPFSECVKTVLREYAEFGYEENTLVSATSDLRTAIRYASGWDGDKSNINWKEVIRCVKNSILKEEDYVSIIALDPHGRRMVFPPSNTLALPFSYYLKKGYGAVESEYGIPAAVRDHEIIAQIPLKELFSMYDLRLLRPDKPMNLDLNLTRIKFPFKKKTSSLRCPRCSKLLEPSVITCLGENNDEIYDLKTIRKNVVIDGKRTSYYSYLQHAEFPTAEFGACFALRNNGVICPRCRAFLTSKHAERKNPPVEVRLVYTSSSKYTFHFDIKNVGSKIINGIRLRPLLYRKDGRLLLAGESLLWTSAPYIEESLSKEGKASWNKRILPGRKERHGPFDLRKCVRSKHILGQTAQYKVELLQVHFQDGSSWYKWGIW